MRGCASRSALPYFFGGLRISSGLALIGAVVAEFVAGTGGTGTGLAYQILPGGYQLNIPRMFAALLLITVTGVLLFAADGVAVASGRWRAGTRAKSRTRADGDAPRCRGAFDKTRPVGVLA